jgi:hypothetical protein
MYSHPHPAGPASLHRGGGGGSFSVAEIHDKKSVLTNHLHYIVEQSLPKPGRGLELAFLRILQTTLLSTACLNLDTVRVNFVTEPLDCIVEQSLPKPRQGG